MISPKGRIEDDTLMNDGEFIQKKQVLGNSVY